MKCVICDEKIPDARLAFLVDNSVPREYLTCIKHSVVQRKQAFYTGLAGASDMILCDKVYSGSVSSAFDTVTEEEEE